MNSSSRQRRLKRTWVALTAGAVAAAALTIRATAQVQRHTCAPPVKALSTESFGDVPAGSTRTCA